MIDILAAGWKPEGVSSALIFVVLAVTYIAFHIVYSIYDVYLGPLSKVRAGLLQGCGLPKALF